MKNYAATRATWLAACAACAALSGCAATAPSYDSLRSEVDRTGFAPAHARAEDDCGLDGPFLERAVFVRAVLQRNPTIDAARSGMARRRRPRATGGLARGPDGRPRFAPLSIGASSVPLGYSATISQRLPWPGKLSLDARCAAAEAAPRRATSSRRARELALTAALLYDQYFASVRSLEINAHHVALMREMKSAALAQFESRPRVGAGPAAGRGGAHAHRSTTPSMLAADAKSPSRR